MKKLKTVVEKDVTDFSTSRHQNRLQDSNED